MSINWLQDAEVTQDLPLSHTPSFDACAVVQDMAATVASTLRLSRLLLGTGRTIDINGLDRIIGLLCARALDLSPEQGRTVRSNLALLLIELDTLSMALRPS